LSPSLQLHDVSSRPRFGCKGPGAPDWLAAHGYRVPESANTAVVDAGVFVARLASSEFLVEAVQSGSERVASTRTQLLQRTQPAAVYPVARQDLVVAISGAGLNTLLRQTCSVDFAPLLASAASDGGAVVLTSIIGVGVVAWPQRTEAGAAVTLWSDPSYAHYFWSTLLELGAGAGSVSIKGSDT
jgi:sarcosine oxidase subunit gamma